MTKCRAIVMLLLCLVASAGVSAQKLAVKTNLLYDATGTINLGAEVKLGKQTTLVLPVNYNPWTFEDNRKLKHLMVQPEFRWWICQPFSGHFFGVHGHGAIFNVGGLKPFGIELSENISEFRYEGWLAGAGISYGYNWVLHPRWSLEATIGVGYAYLEYEKYPYKRCRLKVDESSLHYFGPTKLGLTLVFMIK